MGLEQEDAALALHHARQSFLLQVVHVPAIDSHAWIGNQDLGKELEVKQASVWSGAKKAQAWSPLHPGL